MLTDFGSLDDFLKLDFLLEQVVRPEIKVSISGEQGGKAG